MKASELMIGDFVISKKEDHMNEYAQIDAIEEGQTCILLKQDNVNYFTDISKIEPIPITPEILKKNGIVKHKFECHIEECYSRYIMPTNNEQFILWEETDCFELVLRHIVDNLTYSALRCKVKYVHELQHAIGLCGVNLKIVL